MSYEFPHLMSLLQTPEGINLSHQKEVLCITRIADVRSGSSEWGNRAGVLVDN
jgi:hypothetical protein